MIRFEYTGLSINSNDNTLDLNIYLIARNENLYNVLEFTKKLLKEQFKSQIEIDISNQYYSDLNFEYIKEINDFIETGIVPKVSLVITLSHISLNFFYYMLKQRYQIFCDLLDYYVIYNKVPYAIAKNKQDLYYLVNDIKDLKILADLNYNEQFTDYNLSKYEFSNFKFLYFYFDHDYDMSEFEYQITSNFFCNTNSNFIVQEYQKITDIPEYILDTVAEYLEISVGDIFENRFTMLDILEIYNKVR